MENYSAIIEMLNGTRGTADKVKLSPTYQQYLDQCIDAQSKIKENCKDNPELWSLFEQWENAMMGSEAVASDDYYREGFQFGLLMGLEVGMSATKLKNGE